MTHQLIEIKKLDRSPLNVRKTDSHAALEELKASILAHGLMQNLVVVPAKRGKYHVIAGGRRLEALRQLWNEGKLPSDYAVPCQIAEAGQAAELSLAENVVRQAMHPADQFEAWSALAEQGLTAADIALRFGVEEKLVLKRLKLGRVAPAIMVAFRAGELTLEAVSAFTVTDDHKRQVAVFKSLSGWQKDNDSHIRRCLMKDAVRGDDKLAKFVGLEAYAAAGGKSRTDLFAETVYLEKPELLNKLADEKLEAAVQALRAEGWGWVEVEGRDEKSSPYRCERIRPKAVNAPDYLMGEKQRLVAEGQEIEDAIDATEDEGDLDALYERCNANEEAIEAIDGKPEAYAAFDPEGMKHAGCFVEIGDDGELEVTKGLVRPEDKKRLSPEPDEDDDDQRPAKEKPLYTKALTDELETYRLQAAKVAIAGDRDIALDLLIFTAAHSEFATLTLWTGPEVFFKSNYGSIPARARMSAEDRNTPASEAFDAIPATLSLEWAKADDEATRFEQFRALSLKEKLDILAYCTADTLRPTLGGKPTAYEAALALTGVSVAAYWRPTKDNYLSRISKDQLLAIGREVFGEKWAIHRKGWKKADLVNRLDVDFFGPEKAIEHYAKAGERYTEEVVERLRTWLPAGMAFGLGQPEGADATLAA